ncbi:hypothetical protein HK098_007312 [Nowakowskiella sp. JEL0407]|nr:hypothetical protein HK098_007312 [Nowakowskiella sp. JEL0407]
MSASPVLAKPGPYAVELEPGVDYYFCSCGKSKNQPFCDGSHKGSGLSPKKFTVDEKKTYYLCGCKATENAPFCDGTHKKEKGIAKYNEFLLKKNSELQDALTAQKRSANFLGGVAFAALLGGLFIAVLRK